MTISFLRAFKPISAALYDAVRACVAAAIGGAVFALLSLPAAWLTGGLLFSSIAALTLRLPPIHPIIKTTAITLLGVAIGASLNPDVLTAWTKWPASLLLLMLAVVAMLAAPYLVLRWGYNWHPATAFWAASPGALTASLALAEEAQADMKAVVAVHLVRVLAVSLLIPFLVPAPSGSDLANSLVPFDASNMILLLAAASATGWAFKAAWIPGGTFLGAFGATGILTASGIVAFSMPPLVTAAACVVFAASIGGQFGGADLRTLFRLMTASLACLVAAMTVSIAFAWTTATLLGLSFTQVLISYAPGGIDVLVLVAFMLGADPAFVAAHQFVRLATLVLLLPFAGRLVCAAPALSRARAPTRASGD